MEAVKGCGSQRPEAEPGVHQGGQGRRAFPKGELINPVKGYIQASQAKSSKIKAVSMERERQLLALPFS